MLRTAQDDLNANPRHVIFVFGSPSAVRGTFAGLLCQRRLMRCKLTALCAYLSLIGGHNAFCPPIGWERPARGLQRLE